ncbi:hypothetical protein BOX15_Mlig000524g4 [Macrostomum lignano]|uniref:Phosphodiesterase n=1 Tax=Macrostomum lignano TaxID=282301 RepID=A0A267GMH3_9PLAT|nr:hypothetical protein BOX15_Mlig000524g4 [Macrostomum lignano]
MPGRCLLPLCCCCGLCSCRAGRSRRKDGSLGSGGGNGRKGSAASGASANKKAEEAAANTGLPVLPLLPPQSSSDESGSDEEGQDVLPDLPNAGSFQRQQQQQQQQQQRCQHEQPPQPRTTLAASRRGSLYIFRHSDEIIVTPFAQVLHTLRSVHDNVKTLTGADHLPNHTDSAAAPSLATPSSDDEDFSQMADKTLKDLEWCLEQLETIQTHRSVADMASSKFKKLLNMELERMSGSGQGGAASSANQIESYIKSTFLETDDDSAVTPVGKGGSSAAGGSGSGGGSGGDIETGEGRSPRDANGAQATMTKVQVKSTRTPAQLSAIEAGEAQLPPRLGVETPHSEALIQLFETGLDKWGIDIFKVDELSANKPLTSVVYAIFEKRDFFSKFCIHPSTLVSYFSQVEQHYKPDNPYHNAVHAADVTQSTHVLLNAPSIGNVFSDLEILASVFACAIHDVNHPGVTNQFLINTENELAIMYNDMSVLENHHCAVAFKLLQNPGSNIFSQLDDVERRQLRKMVIDMVLATDMSKHMSLLADLKTMVETKKVAGGCLLKLDNYSEKMQIMQNMVHCADLSNPAKPLPLSTQWVTRVMEEFFSQGDREKALGLPVSPMCCRETANVEKSQVSFIDFIVHPLWEAWTELVHPDAEDILNTLEQNRDYYCELSAAKEAEAASKEEAGANKPSS